MSKNLYLMVGIAGSGKSTWLKNNAKGIVISRDAIRFSMITDSDEYFAREDEVYKKFIEEINYALVDNNNVYADATNLTGKSRNRLLSNLNLNGVDVNIIFINTPVEKCIEQNSRREGRAKVAESVIYNQYNQLVKPSYNERYKYKNILEVVYD